MVISWHKVTVVQMVKEEIPRENGLYLVNVSRLFSGFTSKQLLFDITGYGECIHTLPTVNYGDCDANESYYQNNCNA